MTGALTEGVMQVLHLQSGACQPQGLQEACSLLSPCTLRLPPATRDMHKATRLPREAGALLLHTNSLQTGPAYATVYET